MFDSWNFEDRQIWRKYKIWQNLGVPKWRNSLQTRTPKLKISPLTLDWCNFQDRQNEDKIKFEKIWGYQNERIPLKRRRQNSKLNHSPWTDENFQNRQIWKDKIWQNLGVPQWGSPSNEDAKIHTFYLCKLNISQFQDTQANLKER